MPYHTSLFGPGGLTHGPKFTKIGDDLLPTQIYHPAKFHHPASTHAGDSHTKSLQTNKQKIYPQHAYWHVGIISFVLLYLYFHRPQTSRPANAESTQTT